MTSVINILLAHNVLKLIMFKTLFLAEDPLFGTICWKLDRECHVDFCMFLTPHELNFELLMKTLKRKMKRNAWKLSCILLFWNTVFIRSCPVVYVLYTIRYQRQGLRQKGKKSLTPSETWTLMKSHRKWAVPKLTGILPFIDHIHIFYGTYFTFYRLH